LKITSDGKLRTCLFSVWNHDLHEPMSRGASVLRAGIEDDGAHRRVL